MSRGAHLMVALFALALHHAGHAPHGVADLHYRDGQGHGGAGVEVQRQFQRIARRQRRREVEEHDVFAARHEFERRSRWDDEAVRLGHHAHDAVLGDSLVDFHDFGIGAGGGSQAYILVQPIQDRQIRGAVAAGDGRGRAWTAATVSSPAVGWGAGATGGGAAIGGITDVQPVNRPAVRIRQQALINIRICIAVSPTDSAFGSVPSCLCVFVLAFQAGYSRGGGGVGIASASARNGKGANQAEKCGRSGWAGSSWSKSVIGASRLITSSAGNERPAGGWVSATWGAPTP